MEETTNGVYLTKEGYEELKKKLEYLKSEGRVNVANKIEVARSFGDISENSEYDSAREEEAQLSLEISNIENTLRNAQIIKSNKIDTATVSVGNTIEVEDTEFGDVDTYKITGSFESDPTKNLISNESPLGIALMGKKKGDLVEVVTATGSYTVKIKSIK